MSNAKGETKPETIFGVLPGWRKIFLFFFIVQLASIPFLGLLTKQESFATLVYQSALVSWAATEILWGGATVMVITSRLFQDARKWARGKLEREQAEQQAREELRSQMAEFRERLDEYNNLLSEIKRLNLENRELKRRLEE